VRPRHLAAALLAAAAATGCRDSAAPPAAPALGAPIEGTPMVDHFYGAYLDHDPGSGAHDYACGLKAYDGHRGVDILLRNFGEQDAGVAVIAAAQGTVVSLTDGLPDRNTSWDQGGGFGNHVVLSHPGGYSTVYAHLRRGSIAVARGQTVARGERLGLVGSSGRSNWPHLHFEVFGGTTVDPFAGDCSTGTSLWESQLAYQDAFVVTDAGLTDRPLTLATLLERPPTLDAAPAELPELRLWIQVANQRAATMRYELVAPGGAIAQTVERAVGPTFSMRYLLLTIPVAGSLAQPGEWQVRAYQDGQPIRTERFTLSAPAAPATPAAARRAGARRGVLETAVLDQAADGPHGPP
jgi:hypothetical protein